MKEKTESALVLAVRCAAAAKEQKDGLPDGRPPNSSYPVGYPRVLE